MKARISVHLIATAIMLGCAADESSPDQPEGSADFQSSRSQEVNDTPIRDDSLVFYAEGLRLDSSTTIPLQLAMSTEIEVQGFVEKDGKRELFASRASISSSDENVVKTVGLTLKAVGIGTAKISVEYDGKKSYFEVRVSELVTSVLLGPGDFKYWVDNEKKPTLRWSPSTGADHYSIAIARDQSCQDSEMLGATRLLEWEIPVLPSGDYQFCVTAISTFGTRLAGSDQVRYRLDFDPGLPIVVFLYRKDNTEKTLNLRVEGKGIERFYYTIGTKQECVLPDADHRREGHSLGMVTIELDEIFPEESSYSIWVCGWGIDAGNNISKPTLRYLGYDSRKVPGQFNVAVSTTDNNSIAEVSWTESKDALKYELTVARGPNCEDQVVGFTDLSWHDRVAPKHPERTPFILPALPNGTYSLCMWAIRGSHRTEARGGTASFTINNQPTITLKNPPPQRTRDTEFSVTFSGRNLAGYRAMVAMDTGCEVSINSKDFQPPASPFAIQVSAKPGDHKTYFLCYQGIDDLKNRTEIMKYWWVVDRTRPVTPTLELTNKGQDNRLVIKNGHYDVMIVRSHINDFTALSDGETYHVGHRLPGSLGIVRTTSARLDFDPLLGGLVYYDNVQWLPEGTEYFYRVYFNNVKNYSEGSNVVSAIGHDLTVDELEFCTGDFESLCTAVRSGNYLRSYGGGSFIAPGPLLAQDNMVNASLFSYDPFRGWASTFSDPTPFKRVEQLLLFETHSKFLAFSYFRAPPATAPSGAPDIWGTRIIFDQGSLVYHDQPGGRSITPLGVGSGRNTLWMETLRNAVESSPGDFQNVLRIWSIFGIDLGQFLFFAEATSSSDDEITLKSYQADDARLIAYKIPGQPDIGAIRVLSGRRVEDLGLVGSNPECAVLSDIGMSDDGIRVDWQCGYSVYDEISESWTATQ